jgi:hypothetical protein
MIEKGTDEPAHGKAIFERAGSEAMMMMHAVRQVGMMVV